MIMNSNVSSALSNAYITHLILSIKLRPSVFFDENKIIKKEAIWEWINSIETLDRFSFEEITDILLEKDVKFLIFEENEQFIHSQIENLNSALNDVLTFLDKPEQIKNSINDKFNLNAGLYKDNLHLFEKISEKLKDDFYGEDEEEEIYNEEELEEKQDYSRRHSYERPFSIGSQGEYRK